MINTLEFGFFLIEIVIVLGETFHLCWSKKNFLSLLLTFYLCYSQKDFSPWLGTDFSAFAHFI
jgi:hypothetical protein